MATRKSNIARNRWTVGLLDVQPTDVVLEVGCGPGIALEACLSKIDDGLVVGIDHSSVMIGAAARRNAQALRSGRLELHEGGLELLPAIGLKFAKVMSINVVQFFPDMDAAFRSIFAVTQNGGRVATTFMPRNPGARAQDALRKAEVISQSAAAAGFESTRTEVLDLRPVPAVCVIASKASHYPA
jgi:ubiquinone/menaquinone biosynthesis C-methylase UbiE